MAHGSTKTRHVAITCDGGYTNQQMYGSALIDEQVVRWQWGDGTNNRAEYLALRYALDWVLKKWPNERLHLHIRMDSDLVRLQVVGQYACRDDQLKILLADIHDRLAQVEKWDITHISGVTMKAILGH